LVHVENVEIVLFADEVESSVLGLDGATHLSLNAAPHRPAIALLIYRIPFPFKSSFASSRIGILHLNLPVSFVEALFGNWGLQGVLYHGVFHLLVFHFGLMFELW